MLLPVGLDGEFRMIKRVRAPTSRSNAWMSNEKSLSSSSGTGTGVPPATSIIARFDQRQCSEEQVRLGAWADDHLLCVELHAALRPGRLSNGFPQVSHSRWRCVARLAFCNGLPARFPDGIRRLEIRLSNFKVNDIAARGLQRLCAGQNLIGAFWRQVLHAPGEALSPVQCNTPPRTPRPGGTPRACRPQSAPAMPRLPTSTAPPPTARRRPWRISAWPMQSRTRCPRSPVVLPA